MKNSLLILVLLLPLHAQSDLYPEIRTILHEAETAAANIQFLHDRGNPHSWVADLYARAGYLDDAARAYPGSPGLWRARVVYGDFAGAEKSVLSNADPEARAMGLTSLADLLWRMGKAGEARPRYEAARQLLPKVVNLEHRKRMLASINLGVSVLADDPPDLISATPHPRKHIAPQDSPFARFPITVDGFRGLDPKEVTKRAAVNGDFMKELYARMGASDRAGLERVTASASTPFQKALGLASIEHILIQASAPEPAQQYAEKIDAVDSDCRLAKAEALSAAGAAWLKAGDTSRAHPAFDAAIELVKSVPDLAYGKVLVMLTIASDQAKGGIVSSAGSTFKAAKELALGLPLRPPAQKTAIRPAVTVHYRDEAYREMLLTGIRVRDLGAASEAARLWRSVDPNAGGSIVEAWLDAGRTGEAIAAARAIADPSDRVSALLVLARQLLGRAGAPNF